MAGLGWLPRAKKTSREERGNREQESHEQPCGPSDSRVTVRVQGWGAAIHLRPLQPGRGGGGQGAAKPVVTSRVVSYFAIFVF